MLHTTWFYCEHCERLHATDDYDHVEYRDHTLGDLYICTNSLRTCSHCGRDVNPEVEDMIATDGGQICNDC